MAIEWLNRFRALQFMILVGMGLVGKSSFAVVERHHLTVGDSLDLVVEAQAELHLSRRGIIELIENEPGHWILVGLKRGVVVIKIKNSLGKVENQHIVEVIPRDKDGNRSSFFDQPQLSTWICELKELQCHSRQKTIEGLVDDWRLYFYLESLCARHMPCIFKVKLSDSGRRSLESALLTFPLVHDASVSAGGQVAIHVDCEKWKREEIKSLSQHMGLNSNSWFVHCVENVSNYEMLVSARMIDRKAIKNKNLRQLLTHPMAANAIVEDDSALTDENLFHEMLGEPRIGLTLQNSVEIHHGLEIPVVSSAEDAKQYWRKVGFVLKATLIQEKHDRLLLQFDFSLSHPESDQRLTTSQLSTKVWCELGRSHIVGTLETKSERSREKEQIFLAKIPIIGPFFKDRSSSQADGMVVVRVMLTKGEKKS